MIQRIQSLYLFVSFLLSVSLLFLPFVEVLSNGTAQVFDFLSLLEASSEGIILMIINVLVAVLTLIIIFLYNKRERQYRLTRMSMLLFGILLAAIFMVTDMYASSLEGAGQEVLVNYQFGSYIPILNLLLNFLAVRAIKKDIQLVQAADRIR